MADKYTFLIEQLLQIIAQKDQQIDALQAEVNSLKMKTTLSPNTDHHVISLQDILKAIPGNVFWKDTDGRYLGCSNNLAKYLGLRSPDDIVGKRNSHLMIPEEAEYLDNIDQEIILSKTGKQLEEVGFDQHTVFFTHKIPFCNSSGNVIGLLGISIDITERKKMEEDLRIAKEKAVASNRAKTQFLAVVNHELRTPLVSILGLLNILKQDTTSIEEKEKIINTIGNCADYLLNLVNDMLEFSRLGKNEYNLRITPVNLGALVEKVIDMVKTLAKNKGLEFHFYSDPNIPETILTDTQIIHHILINLLSNAIKFTDTGHVAIEIKNLQQQHNKVLLEIIVRDTGPGIPANKLNLIFEPFQQLEDAYTRQSSRSGTGLGLTIVEKLAKLIKAKINVLSEPGKGSSFSLISEFNIQTNQATTKKLLSSSSAFIEIEQQKKKKKTTSHLHTLKIKPYVLLIEDDPIVQYVHKKMLIDLGCNVEVASHGYEALQMLNQQQHHIIFVDVNLPDINGFEVIKSIRTAKETNYCHIPIVALTVYTGKEEKLACLHAGADEFTNKPISPAHLKKLLNRYVWSRQKLNTANESI